MLKESIVLLCLLALILPAAAVATDGAADDSIARAILTTQIDQREPVDDVAHVPANADSIYFFTELRGLAGRTVTHRWLHDGNNYGDINFDVGGDRWRIWSSKQFSDDLRGEWQVQVVADDGRVLYTRDFRYGEAPAEPAPETGPETEAPADDSAHDE